jgi:hypothetical protein
MTITSYEAAGRRRDVTSPSWTRSPRSRQRAAAKADTSTPSAFPPARAGELDQYADRAADVEQTSLVRPVALDLREPFLEDALEQAPVGHVIAVAEGARVLVPVILLGLIEPHGFRTDGSRETYARPQSAHRTTVKPCFSKSRSRRSLPHTWHGTSSISTADARVAVSAKTLVRVATGSHSCTSSRIARRRRDCQGKRRRTIHPSSSGSDAGV